MEPDDMILVSIDDHVVEPARLASVGADRDLRRTVVSAYNDWHIDELVGEHPGRFISRAVVPFAHRARAAATVAALRASAADVDVSETSRATYRERFVAT